MDQTMDCGVCCEISPNDRFAAMGAPNGAVRVITMEGKYIYRLQQRSSAVAVTFSHDSETLLSAGYKSIYVWSMMDGSCRYVNFRSKVKSY